MTTETTAGELREFAKFLSGHVLTDPSVTGNWPVRDDGSKRVLVVHERDSMGRVFDWLEAEGSPAVMCIRESRGYSIVAIEAVRGCHCEPAADDDCGVNENSDVGMFLLYLRERRGRVNIHRADPVEIFAEEQLHSNDEHLLDA